MRVPSSRVSRFLHLGWGGEAILSEDKVLVGYYIHTPSQWPSIKFRTVGITIGRALCHYIIILLQIARTIRQRQFRNRSDKFNSCARLTSLAMRGAVRIAISHRPTSSSATPVPYGDGPNGAVSERFSVTSTGSSLAEIDLVAPRATTIHRILRLQTGSRLHLRRWLRIETSARRPR